MSEILDRAYDEKYCSSCGAIILKEAEICPKCGVRQRNVSSEEVSTSWLVSLLLCIFLGGIGAHRFYVKKIGTGILMLITLGGCGIWVLIDLIMIVTGKFTDSDGHHITQK